MHGMRANVGKSHATNNSHNATWVPENQFGRTIPNPMAEVGKHIEGKSAQVVKAIKKGEAHNATGATFHKEVAKQSIKLERQADKRDSMLSRLLADQERARDAEQLQTATQGAAFDSYCASKRQQAESGGATPVPGGGGSSPPLGTGSDVAGGGQGGDHLDDAYNDFFGKPPAKGSPSTAAAVATVNAAAAAAGGIHGGDPNVGSDEVYDTGTPPGAHAAGTSTPTNVAIAAGVASAEQELAAIAKVQRGRGEVTIPVTRIGKSPAVWAKSDADTDAAAFGGKVDLHALLDVRIMTPAAFRTETPYGFSPEDVQAILAKHSGIMAGNDYDSYSDSDSD